MILFIIWQNVRKIPKYNAIFAFFWLFFKPFRKNILFGKTTISCVSQKSFSLYLVFYP